MSFDSFNDVRSNWKYSGSSNLPKSDKDKSANAYDDSTHTAITSKSTKTAHNIQTKKSLMWGIGWLFILPILIMMFLLRKKKRKPIIKYGVMALDFVLNNRLDWEIR